VAFDGDDKVISLTLVKENTTIVPDQISGPHGPTYFGATLYYVNVSILSQASLDIAGEL